ncbi:hypothetical protein LRR18_10585 [Mangrovimonas sp. AS39]|uniref:hypothetical protein n=1 Tax=Mangrovimonas futianensis TaxID=2895523 RepID=UPI001E5BF604|nr:hypothetical protein [Mangrovimonas futianensis]MCF1192029.1 hypothetical protein [Mangrovimonas futianensis]MCF1195723.1 hypothetical protein [Mangrovimonas futianensis]
MSWAILLFNSNQQIPSDLDFDENILKPIFFSDIIERSFPEIKTQNNHREIIGIDYSIEFFSDQEAAGTKMINLYGENGLFEMIELAKIYDWQIYDTSLNDFIDLENPEKNGFKNHKKYVKQIIESKVFLKSKYDYELNKCILVQGDIHSVWAYVIDITDNKDEIEFDGFICSRGTIIQTKDEIETYINDDQGFAPPLLGDYKNKHSVIKDLVEANIEIEWNNHIVRVLVKGIEYLIMDLKTKKSFSKSISKSGPYGMPLK